MIIANEPVAFLYKQNIEYAKAWSVAEYLKEIPGERKLAMEQLRNEIKKKLPKGFEEVMSYGLIGYAVPHSLYAEGYHCTPELLCHSWT